MSIHKRAKDMGVSDLVKKLEKLEEENAKLKDRIITDENFEDKLAEENKKLKEENDKLKSDLDRFSEAYKKYRDYEKEELAESCYDFARENKKLKEKIQTLELWLDNKEKLNEEYRKKIDTKFKDGFDVLN